MIAQSWIFCGIGTLFCIIGVWQFYRNIYEEEKRLAGPVLLMIAGIILIGLGTAKYFDLIQ